MSKPTKRQREVSDVNAIRQGIRNGAYPSALGDNFFVSELLDTIEVLVAERDARDAEIAALREIAAGEWQGTRVKDNDDGR